MLCCPSGEPHLPYPSQKSHPVGYKPPQTQNKSNPFPPTDIISFLSRISKINPVQPGGTNHTLAWHATLHKHPGCHSGPAPEENLGKRVCVCACQTAKSRHPKRWAQHPLHLGVPAVGNKPCQMFFCKEKVCPPAQAISPGFILRLRCFFTPCIPPRSLSASLSLTSPRPFGEYPQAVAACQGFGAPPLGNPDFTLTNPAHAPQNLWAPVLTQKSRLKPSSRYLMQRRPPRKRPMLLQWLLQRQQRVPDPQARAL